MMFGYRKQTYSCFRKFSRFWALMEKVGVLYAESLGKNWDVTQIALSIFWHANYGNANPEP